MCLADPQRSFVIHSQVLHVRFEEGNSAGLQFVKGAPANRSFLILWQCQSNLQAGPLSTSVNLKGSGLQNAGS